METRDVKCDGDVTLEALSLEPRVVRRKRSLVSVLKRRLVRSLNEVEVCRYQDEEEEREDLMRGPVLHQNHQNQYLRQISCESPNQNGNEYRLRNRASFHFCSTKEIKKLYCQDNSPFQYNPLFMSFSDYHHHCLYSLYSGMKYNTLV